MAEESQQTRVTVPDLVAQTQVRKIVRSLPEAVEMDHHGRPSFRVGGRIFATIWNDEHMNVMFDPDRIRAVVAANPTSCEEFWWGKRLRAVHVDLRTAGASLVQELLTEAWRRKAPKRLWGTSEGPVR
jgi:hypothetical protein